MKDVKKVYFIGGGIAALAGACYLVRDLKYDGANIHIIDELPVLGGSNDGAGNPETGYTLRGGRMWNRSTYENTWELFDSIPSVDNPGKTLKQEIFEFDDANPTHALARLVDKNGKIITDNYCFGFNKNDKKKMFKLLFTSEKRFDNVKIDEYFDKHFFTTNFWYMFSTTFAFNPWHSVIEMRRYIRRFIHEIGNLHDLSAVARTPYNQYDSVTVPMQAYLHSFGVNFDTNCTVTDVDFKDGEGITVSTLYIEKNGEAETIKISEDEVVIITNGCMTDTWSWGDLKHCPQKITDKGSCFSLWDKIAAKRPNMGNPEKFDGNVEESAWGSITVTFKDSLFFDTMEKFSGNRAGTGALVTLKDSNWLASLVLAHQPHFKDQPKDVTVCFGICYRPFAEGNYIKKPFYECTGEEVMTEYLEHFHFNNKQAILDSIIDCKPLFTPRGIAQFMVRSGDDRPSVIPAGSTNLAFIGQFCEMKDDVVFTEEYSVRSARTAVYGLFDFDGNVEKVKKYINRPSVLLKAGLVTNRTK